MFLFCTSCGRPPVSVRRTHDEDWVCPCGDIEAWYPREQEGCAHLAVWVRSGTNELRVTLKEFGIALSLFISSTGMETRVLPEDGLHFLRVASVMDS